LKRLLREVETLIERFDAQSLVIGLPLKVDGSSAVLPKTPRGWHVTLPSHYISLSSCRMSD
jgi:hypothetical protein